MNLVPIALLFGVSVVASAQEPATQPATQPATRPARVQAKPVRLLNDEIGDVCREIRSVLTIGHAPDTNDAMREVIAEERALIIKKYVATLPGRRGPLEFTVSNVTAPDGAAGLWRVTGDFECVISEILTEDAKAEIAKIKRETDAAVKRYFDNNRPAPRPKRQMPIGFYMDDDSDDAVAAIRARGQKRIDAVRAKCRVVSTNSVAVPVAASEAGRWRVGQLVVLPVQIQVASPRFGIVMPKDPSGVGKADESESLKKLLQVDSDTARRLRVDFALNAIKDD